MGRIKYQEAAGLEVKRGRLLKGKAPNKEELARFYCKKGKTAEEIGRAFGCSQDTILRLLERYGLRQRKTVNKLKGYRLADLKGLVAKEGAARAAYKLGVDRKTLYRNIRKMEESSTST
jgi:transposase-like protein